MIKYHIGIYLDIIINQFNRCMLIMKFLSFYKKNGTAVVSTPAPDTGINEILICR